MEDNKKPNNPPAFPNNEGAADSGGMTLRDYFAAKAMDAVINNSSVRRMSIKSRILLLLNMKGWKVDVEINYDSVSKAAYDIADAMLKQREL